MACQHQLSAAADLLLAAADMIQIAFSFLLHPGECTDTNSTSTPFLINDVQLSIGQRRLNLLLDPITNLQQACFASLAFQDQKNGVCGEVIGLARSGDPYLCPVLAIVRCVLHWRTHSKNVHCPLACVYSSPICTTPLYHTTAIHRAVTATGPSTLGFLPSDVSA